MKKKPQRAISPLAEAEMEVLEEGREWLRKRLERKLQRLADRQWAISRPQRSSPEERIGESDHVGVESR